MEASGLISHKCRLDAARLWYTVPVRSHGDKVRCGKKHFETLGVDFNVAVTADEV